jgi:beta-glucanase (GH16 family)
MNVNHRPWSRRRALAAMTAFVPAAALLVATGSHAGATVPPAPSGWTTVFSDDFNGAAGTGVDTTNWLYDTGTGYPGGAANWGTGEVETMTNSTANVYQDGQGHLVIKPIMDKRHQWTSGRIETQRTDFAAPAGGQMEITASIEQPNPSSGLGYWPAFWALGAAARPVAATNWPSIGELDTMEDVNGLSEVAHTLHCGVNPGGPCNETNGLGSGLLPCAGCQTGYHTYSVIVDRRTAGAEQLRFYTDDVLQYTINQSQMDATTWANAVDHGFFIILNVAIGGGFPNGVCNCTTPTHTTTSGAGMSVDYVAVYES